MFFLEAWNNSSGNAWINVMVWVALSLLFFETLNFFTRERFVQWIEKSKGTQPIIAALLGIIPGCGATLFLVPLYNKRKLTFGALVASFIATMGDASFVILTQDPMSFLIITVITSIVGVIVGYIIDLSPIGDRITAESNRDENKQQERQVQKALSREEKKLIPDWYSVGEKYGITILFWLSIFVATPAAIMTLSIPDIDSSPVLGYYTAMEWMSLVIVLFFLLHYLIRKLLLNYYVHRDDRVHMDDIHHGGMHKKDFIHILSDTTTASIFMLFWIFMGTFAYELIVVEIVGEEEFIDFITVETMLFLMIFIGAIVGLLPGCGPQIAFATIFIRGGMTGAALTANTISQDGDAGFPLIATDKRGFIWIKIINFIPAIIVGLIMLIPAIEWFTFAV